TRMTLSLPRKVILLGSGALKIGEAGEFDYSGSQCLKALEEDGVYAVIVNPNIATLQTDPPKHGRVYFQPLTPEFVAPILEAERADGILLSFGGQTALNCGVQLSDQGVLRRTSTKVLGTPLAGIRATEDRAKFVRTMGKARVPTLPSRAVYSYEEALEAAETLGTRRWSASRSLSEARAAGSPGRRRSCARSSRAACERARSDRSSSNGTWASSSSSSTRSSGMRRGTRSPSATWRTSSGCASTPGTTSSSPRARR